MKSKKTKVRDLWTHTLFNNNACYEKIDMMHIFEKAEKEIAYRKRNKRINKRSNIIIIPVLICFLTLIIFTTISIKGVKASLIIHLQPLISLFVENSQAENFTLGIYEPTQIMELDKGIKLMVYEIDDQLIKLHILPLDSVDYIYSDNFESVRKFNTKTKFGDIECLVDYDGFYSCSILTSNYKIMVLSTPFSDKPTNSDELFIEILNMIEILH